ncbi:type 1 glutamine amidotransferase domain-containing protein [Oerskovia sp. M15]
MAKVLMVVSGASTLTLADGTEHPTGYWAEEVAASHRVLSEAGLVVEIATPGGTVPVIDPISLDARGGVDPAEGESFSAYLATVGDLATPRALGDGRAEDYVAVFVPGGHAPMADLADDPDLGRLLTESDTDRRLVAALCHGVAGLLSARREDGSFAFAGRRVTSFTDEEERQGGLGDASPYLVESRLRERERSSRPARRGAAPSWSTGTS